jgi:hypothetical protein
MYVHIVMQDSCVIGAWTSPVDAAEHAKRFARACVVKYRCNSGKEPRAIVICRSPTPASSPPIASEVVSLGQ